MEQLENDLNYYIKKNFIKPPEICQCGNTKIYLNKYSKYKINPFCFRCSKNKCKKIHSLLENSFFKDFKFLAISLSMDIFKCFIDFNFNSKEAYNYLTNTKGYTISEALIRKFYTKIRRYIYIYTL
jgi:hypothetical protein